MRVIDIKELKEDTLYIIEKDNLDIVVENIVDGSLVLGVKGENRDEVRKVAKSFVNSFRREFDDKYLSKPWSTLGVALRNKLRSLGVHDIIFYGDRVIKDYLEYESSAFYNIETFKLNLKEMGIKEKNIEVSEVDKLYKVLVYFDSEKDAKEFYIEWVNRYYSSDNDLYYMYLNSFLDYGEKPIIKENDKGYYLEAYIYK